MASGLIWPRRWRANCTMSTKLGGVLRHHSPGSDAGRGEADCGTVGRRRRRLPGGQLPSFWAEWNGKYRDTVRRFWKGDAGQLSDFAYRLTGSSDLYQFDGRKPYASINFVTAHDGFTLCDLVSYNEKHNEANGDNNEDGRTTTIRGIWARKGRLMIQTSMTCANGRCAISWRLCCFARVFPC